MGKPNEFPANFPQTPRSGGGMQNRLLTYKSSARAPLGARAGFEQTIGGVQRRLLLPNERFRRSEPRCLGVRPQMTGRSEEGARCRPRRGERRWNGGRLCVFGASIFRSDGVCQLGTERIRRATSSAAERAFFRVGHCVPARRLGAEGVSAGDLPSAGRQKVRGG